MKNMEIFRDCKGYEGKYQISNYGRVWSISRQKFLKPLDNSIGYNFVRLCAKNGKIKTEYIHRLVALAFIPNPEHKPQVNHKDENKKNNCVDNLEWMTAEENINYGTRIQRVAEKISKSVLCIETGVVYKSLAEAKRLTSISDSNISQCCLGRQKTAGGYHWKYVEIVGDDVA